MNKLVANKIGNKAYDLVKNVKENKECPSCALSNFNGFVDGLAYSNLISSKEVKMCNTFFKERLEHELIIKKEEQRNEKQMNDLLMDIMMIISFIEQMEEMEEDPLENMFDDILKVLMN